MCIRDRSWSQVEDSCFSDYQKNSSGPDYSIPRLYNEALVILSDGTVWQYRGHWDGMQWIENDVEFNSFYRVSDTEIYAGAADGLYQYNGTTWNKVETANISGSLEVASGNADGKLLLMAGKNNYDPYLWDGSSATKLSLEGLHLNNANSAQSLSLIHIFYFCLLGRDELNSVWKIFVFAPCISRKKLYNELKRKPFVKYKFYKR